MLVDGERAVGRVRGSIDLSQYALANVEKIEVVKGTGVHALRLRRDGWRYQYHNAETEPEFSSRQFVFRLRQSRQLEPFG